MTTTADPNPWERLPPHINEWTQEQVFKDGSAQNYSKTNWTFYHDEVDSINEWLIPNVKGKVFLDVGSNLGIWSVVAALCGAKEIHLFEPHPIALREAVDNVTRVDSGALIFSTLGHVGDQTVGHIRLDDYKLAERVDFIKIDVEGMELEVLSGAKNLIEINHPMLMVENHCGEERDQQILKMLEGYKLGAPVKDFSNHRHLFLI